MTGTVVVWLLEQQVAPGALPNSWSVLAVFSSEAAAEAAQGKMEEQHARVFGLDRGPVLRVREMEVRS